MRSALSFLSLALSVASLGGPLGCLAHGPRTADAPPNSKPVTPSEALFPGPTSSESDIGGLSQEDVEEQFQALRPHFLGCVQRATDRVSAIGGRATLRMRVDRKGSVRWAYLTDSTLGDRATETCVLTVVKSRRWPLPLSGDGLAESSFEIDASEEPSVWAKYQTSALAHKARIATRKCRNGFKGEFRATAYVSPGGEVMAAGVAPPDERGEEAADCIVEAIRELRLRSLPAAQQSPAKVSFSL